MIRLYFIGIIYILIIIPHTVNTFFLQNMTNIAVTRNLTCQLNNNETSPSDFQLCAIRFYSGLNGSQEISFTLYNGLRYMNTFRRYIQKYCGGEIETISDGGTGVWSCDVRLPFESYTSMQICVCASNNCNEKLNTCRNSAINSISMSSPIDFMPNLTSIIQCNDTLNASNTCTEYPFINVSSCQDYIRSTSVLCAITINNSMTTQQSLIYENYEIYLSEKVYQAISIFNMFFNIVLNETTNSVYFKYTDPAARPVEECVCTNSLCNQNITICPSQTTLQVETTISTFPSTDTSSANFTTDTSALVELSSMSNSISTVTTTIEMSTTATFSTSTTITSTTTTSSISATTNFTTTTSLTLTTTTATDIISSTSIIMIDTEITQSTPMTMAATEITLSTPTTAIITEVTPFTPTATVVTEITPSTLTATIVTEITPSKPTTAIITEVTLSTPTATVVTEITPSTLTATIVTEITSSKPTTAIVTEITPTTATQPLTITSSSNQQNSVQGEPGLGKAATAGLACGIIFSAVIFIGEIIFFKFFYSGGAASGGFERSVAYRA
ncbi:unnamed protein product [Rotaria sp. Silwood2]|nr:unnamed protein product [Rotaria sp. Silwood2]CAF4218534.1 unnamed protein product [Rotaria sp. Silwood2]